MSRGKRSAAAINRQSQKMRRATDTRVVIADELFAAASHFRVVAIQNTGNEFTQIVLDLTLILGRGWNDLRLSDQSVVTDPVAMV
jgi:hypothetical protein